MCIYINYERTKCCRLQILKRYFLLAPFLLLLGSFLADQCVNLIYKEQDVLNLAITKGGTK